MSTTWQKDNKLVLDEWDKIIVGRNPDKANKLLITVSWIDDDETKFFAVVHWENGREYVYRPGEGGLYCPSISPAYINNSCRYSCRSWIPSAHPVNSLGAIIGYTSGYFYSNMGIKFTENNTTSYLFVGPKFYLPIRYTGTIPASNTAVYHNDNISSYTIGDIITRWVEGVGYDPVFPPDFSVTTSLGVTFNIEKTGRWYCEDYSGNEYYVDF